MPHLILEYSANVSEPDFCGFFRECHQLLTNALPTELKTCKSRAIKYQDFYVGDGDAHNAFVHLTLKIMPGRSMKVLQTVSQALLELLKKYFSESFKRGNLKISIEINELAQPYISI